MLGGVGWKSPARSLPDLREFFPSDHDFVDFCEAFRLRSPLKEHCRVAVRPAQGQTVDIKAHIRGVPDFPKPGILFYDISTLLSDPDAWQVAMGRMARAVAPALPDLLAGIESRGFLVAAPLALKLGLGFVMLRKPGKLPGRTVGLDYALEYGSDRIEMQHDAVRPGQRVVIVDDLLATGGTMAAGITLLRQGGATVPAAAALIELGFLGGRARIDVPFSALVTYDS
jgi:adenine phosphoribosyltransferase